MNADIIAASFPDTIKLPAELRSLCDWAVENGDLISGYFELREHDDETIRCWFGTDLAVGDLAQFGAGPDGSLYCLWRTQDGRLPIVHLGSEGDNNIVLASTPVDFLRVLAIGYAELGHAVLDAPPPPDEEGEENVNPKFQQWVGETYGVTIPEMGAEISGSAQAAHEGFQEWIDARCG